MFPFHSPGMISPATPNDPRGALPDTPLSPIVSRWQQLASMDQQSPGFLPLLSSLTAEHNRSSTTKLHGNDARVTLNVMDEVFGGGKIPAGYERDTLCTMRKLAYNSGQVPHRYQVNRDFLIVEKGVIASGAFADVRKGRLGGKTVAIRTLRIDRQSDNNEPKKLFCKESIIWMNVSHPNLLRLIAIDVNPRTGQCSMISEMMMNGNIREYIRKNSANRHRLLEGAAAGLCYLHQRGIVHGDLKGHNILITNETPPQACLADFGLSTLAPSSQGAATTITAGGTPLYMAPELLVPTKFGKPNARPTQPADIYALGMVILEVLTGFQPFYEQNWTVSELTYHVLYGTRPTKPSDAGRIGFGGGTWELVEKCWMEEPTRRPTIERVLSHLTRVAASSAIVGPTPEIPHESTGSHPESDSTNQIRSFDSATTTTLHESAIPATPLISVNQTATVDTVDAVSPASTISSFNAISLIRRDGRSAQVLNPEQTILRQWRHLASHDLKSTDHRQIATLVDNEDNRKIALGFRGEHAAIVINTIDKPNILINNEAPPQACISDFGLCAIVPSGSFGPTGMGGCGTFGYMAPELFSEGANVSKETDMYAFGMVVYEVITGVRLYRDRGPFELPLLITQGLRPPRPEDPDAVGFGEGTWEFIEKCWNKDRKQRHTAREAAEHFERVARTSTVIDPGPTIPIHEPMGEAHSRLGNSSKGLSQYLLPDNTSSQIICPCVNIMETEQRPSQINPQYGGKD
ncbi:kinase-like protein [Thelephora ganbajun]|uniref:Kinase-like protein n=1 Tax=Thelephora ganbajun TaxID=370292 RepID=A0ACB6Z4B0_THEGA|nr:kinase-like protein [Thelephora ganbajun]